MQTDGSVVVCLAENKPQLPETHTARAPAVHLNMHLISARDSNRWLGGASRELRDEIDRAIKRHV